MAGTADSMRSGPAQPAGGNPDGSLPLAAAAASGNQYQVLAAAINEQIQLIYHTTITLLQYPSQGNFLWYYENANQVFNNGTFGYLSARVSAGDVAGLAQLSGPGGYPNAYAQLLSQIEYGVSSADVAAHDQQAASQAGYGNQVLAELRQATNQPTAANGGMLTVDPDTGAVSSGCQVGYAVNTPLATIQNTLLWGQPTVTVQVPAGSGVTATISYPGCLLVALQPAAWQQAANIGWYDPDPLAEAFANGQQDVTGYRFTSPPSYLPGPLAAGGNFGRLVSLLISDQPVVSFGATNAATFQNSLDCDVVSEVAPGVVSDFYDSLSLLNLAGSADTELLQVSADQNSPTVPLLQQSAYVIGAALSFIPAAG